MTRMAFQGGRPQTFGDCAMVALKAVSHSATSVPRPSCSFKYTIAFSAPGVRFNQILKGKKNSKLFVFSMNVFVLIHFRMHVNGYMVRSHHAVLILYISGNNVQRPSEFVSIPFAPFLSAPNHGGFIRHAHSEQQFAC